MLYGNCFEELAETNYKKKEENQLVNDYIFSSNSERKYDYIITDMRRHRIIETVKACRHLSFNCFKKRTPFYMQQVSWIWLWSLKRLIWVDDMCCTTVNKMPIILNFTLPRCLFAQVFTIVESPSVKAVKGDRDGVKWFVDDP